MSRTVRLDDRLIEIAEAAADIHSRSIASQLAHWVNIGRAIERSPLFDLSIIENMLASELAYDDLSPAEQTIFLEKLNTYMRALGDNGDTTIDDEFAALGKEANDLGYTEKAAAS